LRSAIPVGNGSRWLDNGTFRTRLKENLQKILSLGNRLPAGE
jgi:hypothetical protein